MEKFCQGKFVKSCCSLRKSVALSGFRALAKGHRFSNEKSIFHRI